MIELAGVRYITASEAAEYLGPDVTPELVRDWKRRGLIVGHRVGRCTWYRLDDLTEVEYQVRINRAGRPRHAAPAGQNRL